MNRNILTKYRLFLDLDGVLADFDGGVEQILGIKPNRSAPKAPPGMWEAIDAHPDFFGQLDVLAEAPTLVDFCMPYYPVVLTGLPDSHRDLVSRQKVRWVAERISPALPVLTCSSKDKINVARGVIPEGVTPVLVDDWTKYRHVWEEGGGIFILHTSAQDSIRQLRELGF